MYEMAVSTTHINIGFCFIRSSEATLLSVEVASSIKVRADVSTTKTTP